MTSSLLKSIQVLTAKRSLFFRQQVSLGSSVAKLVIDLNWIINLTNAGRYFFNPLKVPRRATASGLRSGRFIAVFLALSFGAASVSACNKTAPPQAAAPALKKAALGPDEPYKTMPPDLFKSMPMYPGATVEHVRRPKGAMREIVFSTGASMPQLVAFFKDQLKKKDFVVTSSLIMPARRTWSCDFHKDGRPGNILLYPSDNDKSKMTIDLIYEIPTKVDESMLEPREDFDVVGPGPVGRQAAIPGKNTKKN